MSRSVFKYNSNSIWLRHPCCCAVRAFGHACLQAHTSPSSPWQPVLLLWQQTIILSKHTNQIWSLVNYVVDTLWLKDHTWKTHLLANWNTLWVSLERKKRKRKKKNSNIKKHQQQKTLSVLRIYMKPVNAFKCIISNNRGRSACDGQGVKWVWIDL